MEVISILMAFIPIDFDNGFGMVQQAITIKYMLH
jgi:hypothetical protein